MSNTKRRDKKGRILLMGELQKKNGLYSYKYIDKFGKRKEITSWRLTDADPMPAGKRLKPSLRTLEKKVQKDLEIGLTNSSITVLELVDRYVSTKVNTTHNTQAGYKTVHNVLAKEEFGARKITDVKYSEALLFLQELQRNGRSYSSVQSIRGVLRPAFEMARRDELIVTNPFSFELADALINDTVKREALSRANERKLMNFIASDKHYCQYYYGIKALFKTGLRISEFCGLTISDIDFDQMTIDVNCQLQKERNGKYVIVRTKTEAGKRILPMDEETAECFHQIIQNRKKLKVEPIIDGKTGFLFFDKNNNPTVGMHWDKYFQHIREKYNRIYKEQMPLITPHVCRHTYCSRMAKTGISVKTLQHLMGHSDISITMNVYTHFDVEDAREDMEKAGVLKREKVKKAR